MKKTKIKEILKYVEIYGFSLVLLLLTISLLLKITILNRNFIKRQFTNEQYMSVEKNIKTEMKRSMISSGIDNSVIDDIFDSSDVKNSTEQILNIIYKNNSLKLDTTKIENKLKENVKEDLEKNNLKLDNEKGYKSFIKSTIKIYREEFEMLNQASKIGKIISKIEIPILLAIILLSTLLTILILLRRKKITQILPPAILTVSFLILFGTFYIYERAGFANTTIISVTFSTILRKIIKNTFLVFQVTSIIYIIVAIIITSFMKVKRRHHHHHHH